MPAFAGMTRLGQRPQWQTFFAELFFKKATAYLLF
jgi:hypothetical protein